MTPVLAIDCATEVASVALGLREQHRLVSRPGATQQAREIIGMIQQLLDESCCKAKDLQGLIWSAGPGSFTGVRIATSVAQGVAYGLGIPLYPVSSLELAARAVAGRLQPGERLLVTEDARMGEIYWAMFVGAGGQGISRASDDRLSSAADVCDQTSTWITGSAHSLVEFSGATPEWLDCPAERAGYLLPCDIAQLADYRTVNALSAEPVYLRSEKAWKRLDEQ